MPRRSVVVSTTDPRKTSAPSLRMEITDARLMGTSRMMLLGGSLIVAELAEPTASLIVPSTISYLGMPAAKSSRPST